MFLPSDAHMEARFIYCLCQGPHFQNWHCRTVLIILRQGTKNSDYSDTYNGTEVAFWNASHLSRTFLSVYHGLGVKRTPKTEQGVVLPLEGRHQPTIHDQNGYGRSATETVRPDGTKIPGACLVNPSKCFPSPYTHRHSSQLLAFFIGGAGKLAWKHSPLPALRISPITSAWWHHFIQTDVSPLLGKGCFANKYTFWLPH